MAIVWVWGALSATRSSLLKPQHDTVELLEWFFSVVEALEEVEGDAGGLPKCVYTYFDRKLIGGKALRWILSRKFNVVAVPSERQSSNGLVENHWRSMIQIARVYLTEK